MHYWITAAALFIVVLVGILWTFNFMRNSRVSEFSALAVDTHIKRLAQQLPLEVSSDSPEVVSAWFAGKVNFHFELPKYPEGLGYTKNYNLEGARLVSYKGEYGADVSYRMNGRLITLLVVPDDIALPAGGDVIASGNLQFHLQDHRGFHLITWSDRGLTYALVSDLEERGQRSCMVCHHPDSKDQVPALRP